MHRGPLAPIVPLLLLVGCPEQEPPCEGDACGGGDPAVQIRFFTAEPVGVALGESTTLSWDTRNATVCTITTDVGPEPGPVPRSSTLEVAPRLSTTYTLTCEGVGGPVTADAGVSLIGIADAGFDAGYDAGMPTSCVGYAGRPDGVYLVATARPRVVDAGFDAGLDAGPDAGARLDAGLDAGPLDAGFDAGFDAGPLGPPYLVYCLNSVADGGWTLAAKVDGTTSTLSFDDPLWSNETLLVPAGDGLQRGDAKLRAAIGVSFDQVLIGMRPFIEVDGGPVDAGVRWLVLDLAAGSLTRLFNRPFTPTDAGRDGWKGLLPDGELQPFCNREGANVTHQQMSSSFVSTRLGILGNEQDDCFTPDSWIGVGTSSNGSFFSGWTAGGEWAYLEDAGVQDSVPAQAYVLVR